MDENQPLGDQFPVIGGKAMGINETNKDYELLRYKLWIALVRLGESTNDIDVNDGADFAFNIDDEIARLEKEMGNDGDDGPRDCAALHHDD